MTTLTKVTIEQQMAQLKKEVAAKMAELNAQKLAVEAQMKALEAEAKKAKEEATSAAELERMSKFRALVKAGKVVLKENKTEIIMGLMMQDYTKDAIIAYTGYTTKEVTDITWRIYESYGCNADR